MLLSEKFLNVNFKKRVYNKYRHSEVGAILNVRNV
jgi:hypothetical protein